MRRSSFLLLFLIGMLLLVSCSRSPSLQSGNETTATPVASESISSTVPMTASPSTLFPPPPDGRSVISIDTLGTAVPINPALFGTNVPAWLGPDRLNDSNNQALTRALGSPMLRLPGGSWSNSYSWLACENGDSDGCYWTWAARPTDFLNFLRATGSQAIWTVSINGTAQEAAALVAFFNGSVTDTTSIGMDPSGRDWKTVADWAKLRAEHGNPDPFPITYWEVGNEVYGGKPDHGGASCAAWGWEDVWTCDGAEYISGRSDGDSSHQGYLDFRNAMRAVDPSILVGAVGVDDPASWTNWGSKIIAVAGDNLDFYVVHLYGYDRQPPDSAQILSRPQQLWESVVENIQAASDQYAGGRPLPVAVTEYNLVAVQDLDNEQRMSQMVNALFVADVVGQMAVHGVDMAAQWALMNGKANNGTDYGLLDADNGTRSPQYYALALWNRFGNALLPLNSPFSTETELSAYAGKSDDGTISLLAINKTSKPIDLQVQFPGLARPMMASADVLISTSLDSIYCTFNGVASPAADLSDAPAA
ncbi:MAG: alpha-L-arabinofuranosidase, partial [Oscillochloris sp.]|nr:alpha-L-arabinofuranosidase [Oscillochloris sp.]